ncbi:MAG TPA: radical SAM protein [Polyangia bacterium]|nr:radical SAM protein [Polyangia bacterium]
MKILFVATRKNSRPEDRELYEMDFMTRVLGFKRSLADLGLLTVAACTPEDVEVEIVDEYLEPIPYDTDADLVALSAKTSCVTHAYEVAAEFRRRGRKVVLGGIHASLRPDEALEHVDHVVVGEAERSWPAFVRAFARGEAPRLQPDDGFPPMSEIPPPAWRGVDHAQYLFHQIQTTRGCPFKCRFCSVPDISGSTFRFKPVECVVRELAALPRAGRLRERMKATYVVDDNFISKVPYTKDLLRAFAPLYAAGELGEWSAETTLNVARDEEMLDLFRDAGCSTLIIGFESVSEATLLTMDKKVNFCLTFQDAIARIHERGMAIVGNFIVGFDTDTLSVFRDTLRFIDDNAILYPFFSILTPMPGTALHDEFRAANRLDHLDWARYDTRHVVYEPRHMTREQLMDGYVYLFEQAYATTAALDRLEAYWRRYRQRRSGALENAFIKWRLRPFRREGTARFQALMREGWSRLAARGINSDVAQLLYYYDSAHFVDYLDRYKSPAYAENVRIFRGELDAPVDAQLARKQWQRGRKSLPVVTSSPG